MYFCSVVYSSTTLCLKFFLPREKRPKKVSISINRIELNFKLNTLQKNQIYFFKTLLGEIFIGTTGNDLRRWIAFFPVIDSRYLKRFCYLVTPAFSKHVVRLNK